MRQKDVKEEKRNVQNSLNDFLLYQFDRCFPLTADVQKVLFLFCSRSYLQTAVAYAVSSGSVRTQSLEKSASETFYTPRFEGVSRPLIGRELFRSSSCQMGDDVVARNR